MRVNGITDSINDGCMAGAATGTTPISGSLGKDTNIVIPCSFAIEFEDNWFEFPLTLHYFINLHTTKGASKLQDLFGNGILFREYVLLMDLLRILSYKPSSITRHLQVCDLVFSNVRMLSF